MGYNGHFWWECRDCIYIIGKTIIILSNQISNGWLGNSWTKWTCFIGRENHGKLIRGWSFQPCVITRGYRKIMKKNSWSRPTVGLLEKHWQFWCWFHPGRSHPFFSPRPMSWPWLRLWVLYIRGMMPRLHASIIAVTAYWRTRRHCLWKMIFDSTSKKQTNKRTPTQKLWSANIYNKIKMFIEFYRDLYSSILFTKWWSEGLNFFVPTCLPSTTSMALGTMSLCAFSGCCHRCGYNLKAMQDCGPLWTWWRLVISKNHCCFESKAIDPFCLSL